MKNQLQAVCLKTENLEKAIGIDTANPRFSWQIVSSKEECYQLAYQIQVRTSKGELVWDTGKVDSNCQNEVLYEGTPLKSMMIYHWCVRIWNEQGLLSPWSDPAVFETGILQEKEWQGKWIRNNSAWDPLEGISWIGIEAVSGETVEFCLKFTIDLPLQQAVFDGTGVESWELFVNGKLWRKMNADWKQTSFEPIRYGDLTELIKEGENLLCMKVTAGNHGKAAAIGKLLLRDLQGQERIFSTDESWSIRKEEQEKSAKVIGVYGISPFGRFPRRGPAPLFRKEFDVGEKLQKARMYFCGLGYGHCTINGKAASDSLLGTEYSQYHKSVYYRTFDVTALLKTGKNCLGVELGRGHYSFLKDWIGVMEEQAEQKLLLMLKLWYEDGSCQMVFSDESWKTLLGPTVDDNVWYGEKYDARIQPEGWDQTGFEDRTWEAAESAAAPGGKLKASTMPAIRVTEELEPVNITRISDKIWLYDFGKVVSGGAKLRVQEPAGTRIRLTYAETLLPNGRADMESPNKVIQLWEPGQADCYICSGKGEEIWSPKFTYKGYQYIEAEGIDHEIALTAQVFHNDLKITGSFECSNELFNKIHGLVTPTILNNFHSIPTDTPAYEKRGWTGDAQSICDTALMNLDAQPFFEKWLQDLCDSQKDDGAIPDTCPGPLYYPEAPEWMCAMVILPYQLYMHCGNREILKKCYQNMERYMDYEIRRLNDGMSSNRFYGDWNSPAGARPPEGTSYNATCFVYRCLTLMEEVSCILGKSAKAGEYGKLADEMREMLNERFFEKDTMLYHGEIPCGFRQTPTVLPLAFGIVPEDKRLEVAKSLAEHIHREDQDHLSTGCMGLKFLAPVLTEYGQAETAYRIVNQTDCPSWGYWLSLGATACWEEWTPKTRSVDHFYFGTVDDWFYRYLAGIRPVEAGYRRFLIAPYPCGDVKEVKCSVETPYGRIRVWWKMMETEFCLKLTVPANTTAMIRLPEGEICQKGSGEHQIFVSLREKQENHS